MSGKRAYTVADSISSVCCWPLGTGWRGGGCFCVCGQRSGELSGQWSDLRTAADHITLIQMGISGPYLQTLEVATVDTVLPFITFSNVSMTQTMLCPD